MTRSSATPRGKGSPCRSTRASTKQAFLEDMGTLNLERPEKIVRATEHIAEMAEFIKKLADKGIAYRTEDGSYYFSIAKFPGVRQSYPRKTSEAWKPELALTLTNMKRIMPVISLCGRP